MRFTFGNPNHWRIRSGWREMLKLKIWLWLLEGPLLTFIENIVPSYKTPQPTRLTPQQLEERKEKGLCFKYSKGHKCGEKKLFYTNCEEEEEEEEEPSQDENTEEICYEELTPISCNALEGIITPQSLKIKGYIKKKKVMVLVVLIISFTINQPKL
jgi:hypothetical protein